MLQGITELSNHTAKLVNNSVKASDAQAEYIDEVTNAFESISGVVEELHGNMSSLDSLSTNLSESNNVIIDSLMNQQAASEEMAANAQSSADLSQSNLDDLTNVIGELDEIARIIGSLREIEGMEDVEAPSKEAPIPEVPAPETAGFQPEASFEGPREAEPDMELEEAEPEEVPDEAPIGFTPPSPESLMNGDYDDDWGEKL